jgi:hypothetical protein
LLCCLRILLAENEGLTRLDLERKYVARRGAGLPPWRWS